LNSLNLEIAKKLKAYVDKEKKFPATLTINGVKYNYGTFSYILASTVVNINDKFVKKTYANAPAHIGDHIEKTLSKTEYIALARTIVQYGNTYKRCPNYASYKGLKISPVLFCYCFAKIILFHHANKRYPSSCEFNSNVYKTNTSKKTVSSDEVFNYFVKVFGKVSTIDEALRKVKERGYAYYYDDTYTNKTSIDRMKAKKGINCTDSCQVFYHIAKALGYKVRVLHVYCSGTGGGHVRLQVKHSKHTSGNWINRDPACVLSTNGKPLTSIWCSGGKLLDTNGSWFMQNMNR
jgi:hypothetical protein